MVKNEKLKVYLEEIGLTNAKLILDENYSVINIHYLHLCIDNLQVNISSLHNTALSKEQIQLLNIIENAIKEIQQVLSDIQEILTSQ